MLQDRSMTCAPVFDATKILLTASTELGRSVQALRPLFAARRPSPCP
jgi:hypothetical protein